MSRFIGENSSTKDITKVPNTLMTGLVFLFISTIVLFI